MEFKYVGEHHDYLKAGAGTLFFGGGPLIYYQGNFHNDKKEGQGREYSPTPGPPEPCLESVYVNFSTLGNKWVKYEGSYKDGLKDGAGTLTFTNGETFVGTWAAGSVHGKGEIHYNCGKVVEGDWVNDVK